MYENLFLRLHALALGQGKNFTTECFAHILRYLISNHPLASASLMRKMTDGRVDIEKIAGHDISVRTQVITEQGKPDIEITTPGHVVFIEVKVEAQLGYQQLSSYRKALQAKAPSETVLILLSRYKLESDEKPDVEVRWFQVGDWLQEILEEGIDELGDYFINEFVGFLQARGLMFRPPRSRVSEFLKSYLSRAGKLYWSLSRSRSVEVVLGGKF